MATEHERGYSLTAAYHRYVRDRDHPEYIIGQARRVREAIDNARLPDELREQLRAIVCDQPRCNQPDDDREPS